MTKSPNDNDALYSHEHNRKYKDIYAKGNVK